MWFYIQMWPPYCRSFTWCLALLISRQSLMCGGPQTSRVFRVTSTNLCQCSVSRVTFCDAASPFALSTQLLIKHRRIVGSGRWDFIGNNFNKL